MSYETVIVGLAAVGAAWDIGRRAQLSRSLTGRLTSAHDRIDWLEAEAKVGKERLERLESRCGHLSALIDGGSRRSDERFDALSNAVAALETADKNISNKLAAVPKRRGWAG